MRLDVGIVVTMRRALVRLQAFIDQLSGGRLLARVGRQPVLLLRTTGRRTALSRITPVQYMPYGTDYVVVASAAGSPRPPSWCLSEGEGEGRGG